jgi:inositol-phosphate transport system permease protein
MANLATKKRYKMVLFSRILRGIIPYSILTIPLIVPVSMLAWLIIQAFSDRVTIGLIPGHFTLDNFRFLWEKIQFGTSVYPNIWPVMGNSLFLTLTQVGLTVIVSSLAGYAISRMRFPGRSSMMTFIIALHAFPGVLMLVALLYILVKLGLYGKGFLTLAGITLIKTGLEIPMATWILKGFFDGIPWEVEEAAFIDGCSKFMAWRKVLFPIVKPGISAIAVFAFMSGWGEWILAYTYLKDPKWYTLPVLLYSCIGEFKYVDWGFLAAMALFYLIPSLIFFILAQKTLLKIQLVGAVKG